ncbi:acyltransferase family protein [Hymenobacter arcticus]
MPDKNITPEFLKTKKHFEILDSLRGLAAVLVVVYHFAEIAITDVSKNFIWHGFLAVDFFFCLSGFVMAYAYDNRIASMGIMSFIKLRLIRLHPLIIIGSVLGLLTFLIDPYSNLYAVYGFRQTALLFITSSFLIPYPIMPERFFNLFSLNAPVWSLFWEYVANILYATILIKATKKVLVLLISVAVGGIWYVGVHAGNVSGGWAGANFLDGFARVSFSFLAGMLIYRSNWIISNKLGLPGMSALLIGAFLIPYSAQWNWLTEPILIIVYLPLLVSLGAGASLTNKYQKINRFSGSISYPLYMVHYPFVWVFLTYVATQKPSVAQLSWVIPVSILLLIGFAYLVFRFLDFPVRRYLMKRLKTNIIKLH